MIPASHTKYFEKPEVELRREEIPILQSPEVEQSKVSSEAKVEKILGFSSILKETYTHTWKMKGFDEIPFISKFPLYSPSFILGRRNETMWQICMTKHVVWSSKGSESENEEGKSDYDVEELVGSKLDSELGEKVKRLGLRLIKQDDSSSWDVVEYSFILKTPDGYSVTTELKTEAGTDEFECLPHYIYMCDGDFGERNLFNEKDLDIICNITYKYIVGGSLKDSLTPKEMQYSSDIKLLYIHKKFSDLSLIVQGAAIPTHKSILFARVPGFRKLLKDEETLKQKLELMMDVEVVKAMVNFIYSGKIVDKFPLIKCLDLHEAADTYGVNKLKEICSRYFLLNLDPGVCRECLGIQQMFDDCLDGIRKLGAGKLAQILTKSPCSHQNNLV